MTSRQLAILIPLMLAFGSAAAAERGVPVVVTNGANAAVPVLVTNPQGGTPAAPKTTVTELSAGTAATAIPAVGAGKSFLVKHVDLFMSNNSGGPLTDANCVLWLHRGSTSTVVAVYALQRVSLYSSLALSQSEYLVLGPADSLDVTCVSDPSNSSGRVTVGGDVLTGP
jgi:hypothetical protein